MNHTIENLTPRQIVSSLDQYIIGQNEAKKNVAIALRNRWRRMNAPAEMVGEIVPNNILMIGSTGVGKTEIARRLAKLTNAPFVKVEASKFTEIGYVGRDVESMVRDLAEQAFILVKTQKIEQVNESASKIAIQKILDILVPSVGKKTNSSIGFDNTEQHEVLDTDTEVLINQKTREAFLKKIQNNEIEDKTIQISVEAKQTANVGIMGGPMDEASMMKIDEMLSGMMPKKEKKRKVTIAQAKKIFTEEEAQKLIDIEDVKAEAIWRAENLGIIFIDEIDKIAGRNDSGSGPNVSREGVQRDLLPIVEGSSVSTKHGILKTDHVLFIAAGAFHFSKPTDLIPELQGRFPIRVELEDLKAEDLHRILTEPKNSLLRQYTTMLATENVALKFDQEALLKIANYCFEINANMENIGARRLQTLMSQLLKELMFSIPDDLPENNSFTVTADMVDEKLGHLAVNRDLSQYIL